MVVGRKRCLYTVSWYAWLIQHRVFCTLVLCVSISSARNKVNSLLLAEIPLPNEQARLDILKIHAAPITKHGEIDYEGVVKLAEDFNGADLRNVCTEAGWSLSFSLSLWFSHC